MRSQNERSIERLMDGRMSPAEEARFLEQAAADPATARLLAAEQAIAGAIRTDRAAIPLLAPEPGAALLAQLGREAPHAPVGTGARFGAHTIGALLIGMSIVMVGVILMTVYRTPAPAERSRVDSAATLVLTGQGASLTTGNERSPGSTLDGDGSHPSGHTSRTSGIARSTTRHSRPDEAGAIEPGSAQRSMQRPVRNNAPVVFEEDSVHIRMDLREHH